MDASDIEKLSAAVLALDPATEAHWNAKGDPNCLHLKEVLGFAVTGATLLANGLNVTREARAKALAEQGAPQSDPAPEPEPEIKRPGDPPVNVTADVKPPLPEGDTWDGGTTLHRNKRASETLVNHINGMLDILTRMTKKSGIAHEVERDLQEFRKELERTLERL